jgi:hypothetical protein
VIRRSPRSHRLFYEQTTSRGYETGTSGWARAGTRGHDRHVVKHDLQETRDRECPAVSANTAWEPMVRRGRRFESVRGLETKALQIGIWCCLRWRDFDASRVRDGHILGLAGTFGHARRLATQPGTCSTRSHATTAKQSSCKRASGIARADARLTTSFAKEVDLSNGSPANPTAYNTLTPPAST